MEIKLMIDNILDNLSRDLLYIIDITFAKKYNLYEIRRTNIERKCQEYIHIK